MKIYVTGPAIKGQTTGCTAQLPVDDRHPAHPLFGPMVCGWPAAGPHPDRNDGIFRMSGLPGDHDGEQPVVVRSAGES